MKRNAAMIFVAALALATGCGPGEQSAAGQKQLARSPVWPQMLAHCQRSPDCDAMQQVSDGAGQASDQSAEVVWFADRAASGEGGEVTLSVYGLRGHGGPAGRPLTVDEHPDNLTGYHSRRSTLAITYVAGPGATPLASELSFRSAWLEPARTDTSTYLVEIEGAAGVLLSVNGDAAPTGQAAGMPGLSPVTIRFSRNLMQDPAPALLAALAGGETLSLRLKTPGGDIILGDTIYALGYADALEHAAAALVDPEIARPIPDRCARFADEPDSFWAVANVTAALLVCDPRLPQQRR